MRFHILLFMLISTYFVNAEIPFQKEIDSIKQALKVKYSDKTQVDLYNRQSISYRHLGKHQLALDYALKAEKLALKRNYTDGLIESYEQISESYRELGKFDAAIQVLNKKLNLCKQTKDIKGEGNVYDHLGHIFLAKKDTIAALKNHALSLQKRIEANDLYGQGNSYENIGQIYTAQENLPKALQNFKGCLKAFQTLKTDKQRIALAAGNVGLISYWVNQKKEAITYFKLASEIYEELENFDGYDWVSNFLGALYSEAKNYDKAIFQFNKNLEINKKRNQPYGVADAKRHLIKTYLDMGLPDKSLPLIKENIKVYTAYKENGEGNLAETYNSLGRYYRIKNKLDASIPEYEKSIHLAIKVKDARYESNGYQAIGEIYLLQKKYDLAKDYFKKALIYYESVQNYEKLSSIYLSISQSDSAYKDFQSAYSNLNKHLYYYVLHKKEEDDFDNEVFRLDTENKYLKSKIEQERKSAILAKNLTQSKTQRNFAIIGFLIVFVSGIFVYYLLRLRTKKNKVDKQLIEVQQNENMLIKETERFKSQFLINISHELRTPLTLINGHLEILKGNEDFENNEHVQEIQRNGNRLLKLINDILDLSKAESGKYKLVYKQGDVLAEIKALTRSFHSYAEIHTIDYTLESDVDANSDFIQQFIYSSDALNIILTNLLSNAFKYTPDNGQINVNVFQKNDSIGVTITDNGIGIPSESVQKIFNRFYQVDGEHQRAYDSSGIGLSLVKELTLLHGGDITVENNENSGCAFTFWLKKGTNDDISNDVNTTKTTSSEPVFENPAENRNEKQDELPVVLIVEDQADLSSFIVNNLSDSYHCLVAENGREGLQMAIKHIPDLIVSDVMMPEMNGYDMCKQIKETEITSHIPVILLTAKAEQENIIKGLTTGANDYLTKPFSIAELNLRIHNQILTIQKIQHLFQSKEVVQPNEIAQMPSLSDRDKEFLEKIYHYIHLNVSNFQLSVDSIATNMALSNSQLTRKLKSITGLTPANIIKDVRMNNALEMLKNGEFVSDVSWKVGYDNPAYFGKIFKAHFGFTPSEVKK